MFKAPTNLPKTTHDFDGNEIYSETIYSQTYLESSEGTQSNAYNFSQAAVHDYYDNLAMIQEDEPTMEESEQHLSGASVFPLGKNQRLQVLVQMNPAYRNISGTEHHHAKFELFTDQEIGVAQEAEIFNKNLVDSVSNNTIIFYRGLMKTVILIARYCPRPRKCACRIWMTSTSRSLAMGSQGSTKGSETLKTTRFPML